jgi:hypothetical protein
MVALWILGILLLLILLLLFLHVGVELSFGEELRLRAKAGPVSIQLIPKPPKKERPEKKKKKEKKPKKPPAEGEEPKKKRPKPTFADIRSAAPALWTSLRRGLRKTRRRMRIDPLQLSVCFAGDDPSKVAEMYGWAETVMWTVMPQLERLVRIPDPSIHLETDYNSFRIRAEGRLGIWFQVRDLIAIGFAFGIPVLKWYLAWKKEKTAREKAAKQAESTGAEKQRRAATAEGEVIGNE